MKLLTFAFVIIFLILSAAAYFLYVQGLLYWLPDLPRPFKSSQNELVVEGINVGLFPGPDEWVDYGPILEAGSEGDWDFNLAGITAVILKKTGGPYYFYYGGSDGYRSFDGGPRHRAIGLATSEDGIRYQKYEHNPIMTHSPLSHEEEGANSAGITLDQQGNFAMYYGAAIGESDTTINANGRLAVSQDGFNFTDKGIVINRLNPFLYGFGDEIFPTAAFQHQGRWNVYYHPNGSLNERTLGIVWGSHKGRLPRSAGVLDVRSGGVPVYAWSNITWLSPDRIALFIQRLWWPDTFLEVRTASPDAPHRLSEPVVRYDIPNLKHGTVFLDTDRRTWFMIYNEFDRFWRLKLAPAGEPDRTPPTIPANLRGEVTGHDSVQLNWDPASDPDSGVVLYRVYRDGVEVGSTKDRSFEEVGLGEQSSYVYEVSAVNFHGYEGSRASIHLLTPADRTSPRLIAASTGGKRSELIVLFDEPVDRGSAEDAINYTISPDVRVGAASLASDGQTVTLVTTPHAEGIVYTLSVKGINDQAAIPTSITNTELLQYTHSEAAGLSGYWSLDEGEGEVANDFSGYGNHGLVVGAGWEAGVRGSALRFDGINDYVLIEDFPPLDSLTSGNFTFSAWVRPDDRPVGGNPYAILLRVNAHPVYHFGISYSTDGKFQARIITDVEDIHVLSSSPFDPGNWHHLSMAVDIESSLLHLYVDGEPVTGSPMRFSGQLMDLGKKPGDNYPVGEYYFGSTKPDLGAGPFFTQHFKGLLDEISIYNQSLNTNQIKCLVSGCP
jgi:hypothetical protein